MRIFSFSRLGLVLALITACTDSSSLDDTPVEIANVEHQNNCQYGVARWGIGDEAGQSNTQTAERAKKAAKLIKKGKRWSLAHEFHPGMPMLAFPGLIGYEQILLGPIPLDSGIVGQEEQVRSEIGQVGTQIDTLGHMCSRPPGVTDVFAARCYGGFTEGDIFTPNALTHLGIEKIKPYFTRGWLLDVSRALNNGQRLAPGQAVTASMILATLQKQKLKLSDIEEGDVVLVRTGHEDLWDTDPLAYYSATPGLDLGAAQLLASRCIGNVGADNWPVEVQPAVDVVPSGATVPVHEFNLTVAGLPQMESLALNQLAADLADEFDDRHDGDAFSFAFVLNPVPLRGATGSPAAPVALK